MSIRRSAAQLVTSLVLIGMAPSAHAGGVHCNTAGPCCVGGIALGGTECLAAEEEEARNRLHSGPADGCLNLDGTYKSLNTYEVGLGPEGLLFDSWTVTLHEGRVEYYFSDISAVGDYSCSGEEGQVTSDVLKSGPAFFLKGQNYLLWDGRWFKK